MRARRSRRPQAFSREAPTPRASGDGTAGDWPGGWVAITDEIEHPYEWMRIEHADIWLGFSGDQVEGFFGDARLQHYGYALLGTQ